MLSYWAVWTNAVHPEICDNIIRRGGQIPLHDAYIGETGMGRVDRNYRSTTISWFDPNKDKDIVEMINLYVNRANRDFFGFDISHGIFDMQFTIYNADEKGRYNWHHDSFFKSKNRSDRKLSFVLQLSDPLEYEGGQFEFKNFDGTAEFDKNDFLPKGSVLVFPSFLEHRVTEVTAGKRYSLVSWIEGPKWR